VLFIVGWVALLPDHGVCVKPGTFAKPNSGSVLPQLTNFRSKKQCCCHNYMISELSIIFDEPGKGAVADIAMTGTAALVISKLINKSFLVIFAALIMLGIGVHAVFSDPTTLNKKIGLVPDVNSQIRD
jgi:hypothetical protein